MKSNKLECDKCRATFHGEKIDAEKIFICANCTGLDMAGDPTRWRPSFPSVLSFSPDELAVIKFALNSYGMKEGRAAEIRNKCVDIIWKIEQQR